jgi:hypothetical protein
MISTKLQNLLSEGKIGDLLTPMRPDESIIPDNWVKNPDGSYDVDGNVNYTDQHLTKLPYKFGKVTGHFDCGWNKLISLEGCPKEVGKECGFAHNKLTSLIGAPIKVGGWFGCSNNQLTSLTGAPQTVGRDFYCYNNKKKFSEDDVNKVCKVKGEIYV